MKKSLAITIISILAVAAIALGVLYYTNNDQKTKEIANLNENVAQRDGQIDTLNKLVETKNNEIGSLSADVADKAGQIETLNADVEDKAGQIEKLNADIADKAGQIETLNADVADKAGQIDALNADIAGKAGQIETLNADVADKAGQIEKLNADVADKAGQIETLNADVADKAGQIETLNADVADKTGQIEALNADVTDKAGQIEALNADVADKAGQIETLNASVADKASQIEKMASDIAEKDTQITGLKASVDEKEKKIEDLNATISDQKKKLDYDHMSEPDLNEVVKQITPPLEAFGYSVLIRNFSKSSTPTEQESNTTEQQFLADLNKGLEDRWMLSDNTQSDNFTDQQQIEFYQTLVNAELGYLSKYTDLNFEDTVLADYAHTYITALQDQFIAITEYYGKDDATYEQYWSNAYQTRTQMLYWINRKYGLNISDKYKQTLNEMLATGAYIDHYKSVDNSIKTQLEAIELNVIDRNDYSITVQAPSIKNDTAYGIESLSVKILTYDANNNMLEDTYLNSSSSIKSGNKIDLGTGYISKQFDHYELHYEFYISGTISGQNYYDGFKGNVTPKEQFGWNGSIIKNGKLAAGQPIYIIENLIQGWDYSKSWGQTLYVPYLKFSVKNTGDKVGEKVTIKVTFIDQAKNEVWNEKTDYLIGSSDAPLQPGYSKKAFIYSSVGYETVPFTLPALTAEIYINNTLIQTVEIKK